MFNEGKKIFGTAIGYLGLIIWAAGALITSNLTDLPAFELLSFAFILGFTIVAAKLTITKSWHKVKQPWYVWAIGSFAILTQQSGYVFAFKYAPAAQADVIIYMWPILTILMNGLMPNEKLQFKHCLAALLGFMGVFILSTGEAIDTGSNAYTLLGWAAAFICAVVWSSFTVFSRRLKKLPNEMLGMYCGTASIFAIILHYSSEEFIIPNGNQCFFILLLGGFVFGLAYVLWDYGIKKGNMQVLSILSYFNPIISISLLVLFGKSVFHYNIYIACTLIVVGSMVGVINWNFANTMYVWYLRKTGFLRALESSPIASNVSNWYYHIYEGRYFSVKK